MRLPSPPTTSRRWAVLAAVLAAGLAWPCTASAQPRQQPKKLGGEDGKGTVDAVAPGMIRLRLKGGEFWTVVPAPDATVTVVGTAAREMLQPGQFVACSLTLDAFGKVAAPVTQILFPGGGMPGVVAGGLGIPEAGAKRMPGRRPAGTYLVSGPIKLVTDDVVTVQAGRDRFEFPVPAETELVVRTTNFGIASSGDQVEVEGLYINKGELQASSLAITLASPLTPPAKTRGPKRPVR
jgi:hypothetical protein